MKTNVAIEFVFQFITAFVNLKEQYVRDMVARYDEARAIIQEYFEGVRSGAIPARTPPPGLPRFSLGTVERQEVRIEKLEDVVMEDLTVTGRPGHTVATLRQSAATLENAP